MKWWSTSALDPASLVRSCHSGCVYGCEYEGFGMTVIDTWLSLHDMLIHDIYIHHIIVYCLINGMLVCPRQI